MTEKTDPGHKVALVLSGGGAHGAFEVGVMKALFNGASPVNGYQPLSADIFTGTSVGSYNAAFMVSRPGEDSASTVQALEKAWREEVTYHPSRCGNGVYRLRADLLDLADPQCLLNNPLKPLTQLAQDGLFFTRYAIERGRRFAQSSKPLQHRALALFNLSSLVVCEPFVELLRKTIDLQGIRRSDKILRIITTDWDTGHMHAYSNQDMTDQNGLKAIQASAAIPGFFEPIEMDGHPHVDGGVVMNTPLKPALSAGADEIHMIYLDPDVEQIPLHILENTLSTFDRLLTIQLAIKINEDIETLDWINQGLELLDRARRGEEFSHPHLRTFIQTVAQIEKRLTGPAPYRKVTLHRYHPEEDLGGLLDLLNFAPDRIDHIIELGYKEAVEHDCTACQCLLPSREAVEA